MTPPLLTGAQALTAAIRLLAQGGIPDGPTDARRLLAHAMGIAPGRLTLHLPDALPDPVQRAYEGLVARRLGREPVSHLTGTRAFWGRDFRVTPAVLDPRPETEIVVQAALEHPFRTVLDLGSGSGCILLTLLAERPDATGLGVDLSPAALPVAEGNARHLGLTGRARFALSDWYAATTGRFDLIVSNPPYIAAAEMAALQPEVRDHEPRMALTDGADGLTAYRAIAAGALDALAPGGRLIVEIGPTQGAAVATLFAAAGLSEIAVRPDLDGRDRVVAALLRRAP